MPIPLISITTPSYNRPETLLRLLKSIDATDAQSIEIVVCEDKAPKRDEVRATVESFKATSRYTVRYIENEQNLGYDRNIKECLRVANGTYVVYMGDDDEFVAGALDKLIAFLKANPQVRYVLRSYYLVHADGKTERFRYFEGDRFWKPGLEAYLTLFRKSVFISGFTIHRESTLPFLIDDFDGTLLVQLYFVAEIALAHDTAYFDEPLTRGYEGGVPLFGNAAAEKGLYTPGVITVENSLKFLQGFFKITEFVDTKYSLHSTDAIKTDMSKYSYPILSVQRNKGLRVFLGYVRELNKLGFNRSIYYYLYVVLLTVLGKRLCDNGIQLVKRVLGKTPKL